MPASLFRRISDLFNKPHHLRTRRTPSQVPIRRAEILEERRMLSVNVNTVTPELEFDLNQQALPVNFDGGVVIDDILYFAGTNFEWRGDDAEFWSYDPAANNGQGEIKPVELTGDTANLSFIHSLQGGGGKLFFNAYASPGYALFSLDVSTSVLTRIASLQNPERFHQVLENGSLYYRDETSNGNHELWRYTPDEGTVRVASFESDGSEPADAILFLNGKLYLNVIGTGGSVQIWEYDPALEEEATRLVFETTTGDAGSPEMVTSDGKIYVTTEANQRLWEVDPLSDSAGRELFYLPHVPDASGADILDLTALKGKLYWITSQRGAVEFWEYDPQGTADPQNLGYDILPGEYPSIMNLSAGADHLYLFTSLRNQYTTGGINYSFYGEALLQFDPSQDLSEAVTFITDLDLGQSGWYDEGIEAFEVGGALLFPGSSEFRRRNTLWRYDADDEGGPGQLAEVRQAIDLNESSQPHELTVLGNTVYFAANDGIHGYELWKAEIQIDGSLASPTMVSDFYPGIASSYPENLEVIDGVLYFDAEDHGVNHLWKYIPESETLTRLARIGPFTDMVTVGNVRYYLWFGSHNVYFHFYDVTSPPTVDKMTEIPDFLMARMRGGNHATAAVGDHIYFVVNDVEKSQESIYSYNTAAIDGSDALTQIDLPEGISAPDHFTELNGKVYFQANDSTYGEELFEFDPLTESIRRIADIRPGSRGSSPERMTVFDDQLYFRAFDGESIFKLWRFDPLANDGQGGVEVVFASNQHSPFNGASHDPDSPYLIKDGRIYMDLRYSGVLDFDILVLEPRENDRVLPLIEQMDNPPSSYRDYELASSANHIIANLYEELGGKELFSIPTISSEVTAEFRFAADTSMVPGSVENAPDNTLPTFGEWESPVGQLWLTIGPETAAPGFDLTMEVVWDDLWLLAPEVTSHLGTSATVSSQSADSVTFTIADVDLSSYQVGDRVLLGNLTFPLNPTNEKNLSADASGAYPQPTLQQGASLATAKNDTTGQPILFDDDQEDLQLTPMVYDANEDDRVGISDFAAFIRHYGNRADADSPEAYRFDYDQDGKVGISDFALFIQQYGKRKFAPAIPTQTAARAMSGSTAESTKPDTFPLEGESIASVYWESVANDAEVFFNDDRLKGRNGEELELSPAPPLVLDDADWDARVIDAAMNSGSEGETSDEDSSEGEDALLAWLETDSI